jgi:hypothetical protein
MNRPPIRSRRREIHATPVEESALAAHAVAHSELACVHGLNPSMARWLKSALPL